MSRRDDSVPMRHMLDHAREAVAMIKGRTRSGLAAERLLQLAITRLVQIIGEAASRVTTQGRARYAEIPWREVIDTVIESFTVTTPSTTTSSGAS